MIVIFQGYRANIQRTDLFTIYEGCDSNFSEPAGSETWTTFTLSFELHTTKLLTQVKRDLYFEFLDISSLATVNVKRKRKLRFFKFLLQMSDSDSNLYLHCHK